MRLFIVRHGQTSWNTENRAQGHTDIPLDATGQWQAARLAAEFPERMIDAVYCSDLCRCSSTAEPLARRLGVELRVRHALRERSFGCCEGLQFEDLVREIDRIAKESGDGIFDLAPEGGESLRAVWDRLDEVVAELERRRESAVVVTHGGTGSVLMAKLARGTLETSKSFRFGNTGYYELELRPDGFYHLVRANVLSHLDGERALSGSIDGTTR